MVKLLEDKKQMRQVMAFVLAGICLILFYLGVSHFYLISKALSFVADVLRPFIIAFIFAYLLNGPLNFFEKHLNFIDKIGKKPHRKIRRFVAIIITWIIAIAIITAFFSIIMPEVSQSIIDLANSLPDYFESAKSFIGSMIETYDLDENMFQTFLEMEITPSGIMKLFNKYGKALLPQISSLANLTAQVGNFMLDLLVAFIVSVYFMMSKEMLLAQGKKCIYAWMEQEKADRTVRVINITDEAFSGFLGGKILDSAIIGVLCFVGVSLLKFEYPLLISVIVGVTNIIPFFGPFIGAVPSGLLLLVINPWHALWFVVFIVGLQQLDGNVIGPKILGDSTGLPAIWTTFAICLGGGLLGIVGMIIGVPTFAVIYKLTKENVDGNLEKKNMPIDISKYETKGPFEPPNMH